MPVGAYAYSLRSVSRFVGHFRYGSTIVSSLSGCNAIANTAEFFTDGPARSGFPVTVARPPAIRLLDLGPTPSKEEAGRRHSGSTLWEDQSFDPDRGEDALPLPELDWKR